MIWGGDFIAELLNLGHIDSQSEKVQIIQHQLITDFLIGDQKCMEIRNLVNRRLTLKIV